MARLQDVFKLFAKQLKEHIDAGDPNPLETMKESYGGTVWNSGGGCMIWTIRHNNYWMHASHECLCVYYTEDEQQGASCDFEDDSCLLLEVIL